MRSFGQSRLDFQLHAFDAVINLGEAGFDPAFHGGRLVLVQAAFLIDMRGQLAERILERFHGLEAALAAFVIFQHADFVVQHFMRFAQFVDHALNFRGHRGGRVFRRFQSCQETEHRLVDSRNRQG